MASERLVARIHVRAWDGRDDGGHQTGSGLYYVKLVAGATVDTRALVRTR